MLLLHYNRRRNRVSLCRLTLRTLHWSQFTWKVFTGIQKGRVEALPSYEINHDVGPHKRPACSDDLLTHEYRFDTWYHIEKTSCVESILDATLKWLQIEGLKSTHLTCVHQYSFAILYHYQMNAWRWACRAFSIKCRPKDFFHEGSNSKMKYTKQIKTTSHNEVHSISNQSTFAWKCLSL